MIYACRTVTGGEAAVARARAAHPGCRAEFVELDLASFASIRRFADSLAADKIDALICNAGLALMAWGETEEGFERTVGVCHIGHFLLARLLMPRLLASGAPRVVMVSSTSHRTPPKLDFTNLPMTRGTFKGMGAYGQAKLCNVLMAKSLQRRYADRGMTACALHPGTLITTEIGRNSAVVGLLMKLVSPFTKNPARAPPRRCGARCTNRQPTSPASICRTVTSCRVATKPTILPWRNVCGRSAKSGWRARVRPSWP